MLGNPEAAGMSYQHSRKHGRAVEQIKKILLSFSYLIRRKELLREIRQCSPQLLKLTGDSDNSLKQFLGRLHKHFRIDCDGYIHVTKINPGPSPPMHFRGPLRKLAKTWGILRYGQSDWEDIFFCGHAVDLDHRTLDLTAELTEGDIVDCWFLPSVAENGCKYEAFKVWKVDSDESCPVQITSEPLSFPLLCGVARVGYYKAGLGFLVINRGSQDLEKKDVDPSGYAIFNIRHCYIPQDFVVSGNEVVKFLATRLYVENYPCAFWSCKRMWPQQLTKPEPFIEISAVQAATTVNSASTLGGSLLPGKTICPEIFRWQTLMTYTTFPKPRRFEKNQPCIATILYDEAEGDGFITDLRPVDAEMETPMSQEVPEPEELLYQCVAILKRVIVSCGGTCSISSLHGHLGNLSAMQRRLLGRTLKGLTQVLMSQPEHFVLKELDGGHIVSLVGKQDDVTKQDCQPDYIVDGSFQVSKGLTLPVHHRGQIKSLETGWGIIKHGQNQDIFFGRHVLFPVLKSEATKKVLQVANWVDCLYVPAPGKHRFKHAALRVWKVCTEELCPKSQSSEQLLWPILYGEARIAYCNAEVGFFHVVRHDHCPKEECAWDNVTELVIFHLQHCLFAQHMSVTTGARVNFLATKFHGNRSHYRLWDCVTMWKPRLSEPLPRTYEVSANLDFASGKDGCLLLGTSHCPKTFNWEALAVNGPIGAVQLSYKQPLVASVFTAEDGSLIITGLRPKSSSIVSQQSDRYSLASSVSNDTEDSLVTAAFDSISEVSSVPTRSCPPDKLYKPFPDSEANVCATTGIKCNITNESSREVVGSTPCKTVAHEEHRVPIDAIQLTEKQPGPCVETVSTAENSSRMIPSLPRKGSSVVPQQNDQYCLASGISKDTEGSLVITGVDSITGSSMPCRSSPTDILRQPVPVTVPAIDSEANASATTHIKCKIAYESSQEVVGAIHVGHHNAKGMKCNITYDSSGKIVGAIHVAHQGAKGMKCNITYESSGVVVGSTHCKAHKELHVDMQLW